MTTTDLISLAEILRLTYNVNSDREVVIEVPLLWRRNGQEKLIRRMGTEGQDFRCIRNRSGRSVTFHPTQP